MGYQNGSTKIPSEILKKKETMKGRSKTYRNLANIRTTFISKLI